MVTPVLETTRVNYQVLTDEITVRFKRAVGCATAAKDEKKFGLTVGRKMSLF